jgi:hypothetical protein
VKWRGEYPGRRCCGVIGAVFSRQVTCRKIYVQIKVDEGEEEAYHCVVMYLIAKKRCKRMEQQCREIGCLFFKEGVFDGIRERRAEWWEKREEGDGEIENREIERLRDWEIERLRNRESERSRDREIEISRVWEIKILRDREIERLRHREIERSRDWEIERLRYKEREIKRSRG